MDIFSLPTPPSSVAPRPSLPPISQFDRRMPSPLTPPDDMDTSNSPSSSRLPLMKYQQHQHSSPHRPLSPSSRALPFPDPPQSVADWVTSTHKRSARFIAEKTCEMVCYLWFSSNLGPTAASKRRARHISRRTHPHTNSPPFGPYSHTPLSNSSTAALQFNASLPFVQFMQKLLETTQVSQSVIVLSLHYIYRLKERNDLTVGMPGSEFRVAVVALMMANKFVDDNTYTNKTWSDVSGIDLSELNKMEREFLLGVDFRLFVDKTTYESWLNLLKGLVMTKERESLSWVRPRPRVDAGRPVLPSPGRMAVTASSEESERKYERKHSLESASSPAHPHQHHQHHPQHHQEQHEQRQHRHRHQTHQQHSSQSSQRARSSSPLLPSFRSKYAEYAYPFTFAVPAPAPVHALAPAPASNPHSSSSTQDRDEYMSDVSRPYAHSTSNNAATHAKRTAEAAFSPTSASFSHHNLLRPLKQQHQQQQPPVSLSVDIGACSTASSSANDVNAHAVSNGVNGVNGNGNGAERGQGGLYTPTSMESLSLQSFERLSLHNHGSSTTPAATPASAKPPQPQPQQSQAQQLPQDQQTRLPPTALVAPYRLEDGRTHGALPQNLYFYALASSPMHNDKEAEYCVRKSRLRYACPPSSTEVAREEYRDVPPMASLAASSGAGHGHGSGPASAYPSTDSAYRPTAHAVSSHAAHPHTRLTPSATFSSASAHPAASSSASNSIAHLHPLPNTLPPLVLTPPLVLAPLVVQSARTSPREYDYAREAYYSYRQAQQVRQQQQQQEQRQRVEMPLSVPKDAMYHRQVQQQQQQAYAGQSQFHEQQQTQTQPHQPQTTQPQRDGGDEDLRSPVSNDDEEYEEYEYDGDEGEVEEDEEMEVAEEVSYQQPHPASPSPPASSHSHHHHGQQTRAHQHQLAAPATFANAGPPGVHFYASNSTPGLAPYHYQQNHSQHGPHHHLAAYHHHHHHHAIPASAAASTFTSPHVHAMSSSSSLSAGANVNGFHHHGGSGGGLSLGGLASHFSEFGGAHFSQQVLQPLRAPLRRF